MIDRLPSNEIHKNLKKNRLRMLHRPPSMVVLTKCLSYQETHCAEDERSYEEYSMGTRVCVSFVLLEERWIVSHSRDQPARFLTHPSTSASDSRADEHHLRARPPRVRHHLAPAARADERQRHPRHPPGGVVLRRKEERKDRAPFSPFSPFRTRSSTRSPTHAGRFPPPLPRVAGLDAIRPAVTRAQHGVPARGAPCNVARHGPTDAKAGEGGV